LATNLFGRRSIRPRVEFYFGGRPGAVCRAPTSGPGFSFTAHYSAKKTPAPCPNPRKMGSQPPTSAQNGYSGQSARRLKRVVCATPILTALPAPPFSRERKMRHFDEMPTFMCFPFMPGLALEFRASFYGTRKDAGDRFGRCWSPWPSLPARRFSLQLRRLDTQKCWLLRNHLRSRDQHHGP